MEADMGLFTDPASLFLSLIIAIIIVGISVVSMTLLGYLGFLSYKFRDRQQEALESTLIQVALPRDNEIKIDAAEQLFSNFSSLRKGGHFSFLHPQPALSFEIVGMPGDIRF